MSSLFTLSNPSHPIPEKHKYLSKEFLDAVSVRMSSTPHGMVFFNTVPLTLFEKLSKTFGKNAVICPDIRNFYGNECGLVIANNKTAHDKWCSEINQYLKEQYDTEEERWFYGLDTGLSSRCIYNFMSDMGTIRNYAGGTHYLVHVPQDVGDFGRCVRLLEKFPDWKNCLQQMVKKHSEWKDIVDNWDLLEKKYKEILNIQKKLLADKENFAGRETAASNYLKARTKFQKLIRKFIASSKG